MHTYIYIYIYQVLVAFEGQGDPVEGAPDELNICVYIYTYTHEAHKESKHNKHKQP